MPYLRSPHSEWFKAIPLIDNDTPEWAITMYNEDDNWIKIEKLKEIYYKDHNMKLLKEIDQKRALDLLTHGST